MNLKELAKKRGTNLKQVAEKCGIPPTTLYSISRGDTNFDNMGIGTAMKVADALGITVEELYTGEKFAPNAPAAALAPGERQLVDAYRAMSDEGRDKLLDYAAYLQSRHPLNPGVSRSA